MNLLIDGYKLVLTCFACPEQYDVYDDEGTQVAHLRVKHGVFRAECPDYGGENVYEIAVFGDGMFEYIERYEHLREAITRIQKWIIEQNFKQVEWNNDDDE